MPGSRRRRHFHLGVRLETVERIRSGGASIEECARGLRVQPQLIHEWLARHGGERPTSVDEIRRGSERFILQRRVQRLRDYLARTERELTRLHKRLIAALT
jgi:transposase-like protein